MSTQQHFKKKEKKELYENKENRHDKAETATMDLIEEVQANIDNKIEKRLDYSNSQIVKKYFYDDYKTSFPFYFLFLVLGLQVMFFIFIQDDIFLFSAATLLSFFVLYFYVENKDTYYFLRKMSGNSENADEDKHTLEILKYLEKQIFSFTFLHKKQNYLYAILPFVIVDLYAIYVNDIQIAYFNFVLSIIALIPNLFYEKRRIEK